MFIESVGTRAIFKPEKIFIFDFLRVLEPNGQWTFSLPKWLSFQYEALFGGKSLRNLDFFFSEMKFLKVYS